MRTSARPLIRGIALLLAGLMAATEVPAVQAASHREAPLIALDPTADLTDVYAFRSWENDTKAVFIMNVIPQQVPASGPNFFNLDDDVQYSFNFDLNQNGIAEDLRIDFRFKTEIRNNSSAGGLNFKDIPVLGYLFGAKVRTVSKTELLILITPRVIGTAMDAARITEEMRKVTPELEKSIGRAPRHVGRSDA